MFFMLVRGQALIALYLSLHNFYLSRTIGQSLMSSPAVVSYVLASVPIQDHSDSFILIFEKSGLQLISRKGWLSVKTKKI